MKLDYAAEAIPRAQSWLLAHQREDGAWPVKGRLISALTDAEHLKVIDSIYTAWASAWAVIGLLQAFPYAALPR